MTGSSSNNKNVTFERGNKVRLDLTSEQLFLIRSALASEKEVYERVAWDTKNGKLKEGSLELAAKYEALMEYCDAKLEEL